MLEPPTFEGTAEFKVPSVSKACRTWFKIVAELQTQVIPLVMIHGGPEACHDYLLPLEELAASISVVLYDQIDNGRSIHLPEKAGDETFWAAQLFQDKLENLISHLGLKKRPIEVSIPVLSSIKVPTLLINGIQDEAQDEAMGPFFVRIEKVKWIVLNCAAHFSHVDQQKNYITHLSTFLEE